MNELLRRFSANPRLTVELLIASFFASVLALAMPIFVIQVLNRYVAHGVDVTLATLTFGALIAVVFEFAFRQIRLRLAGGLSEKADLDLSGTGLGPEQALGGLRAAPAAGALGGALWMAHRPGIRRAGHVLLLNVAGFGLATFAFGLSTSFWLSLLALALTGAFDNVSMVGRHVVVQMSTPNEMRGRVSAVNAVFVGSSNQLGGFESGTVAHLFTPVISVVSGGVGTLLVVAAWSGLFPSLRRLGSLSSVSAEATRNRGAGPPATPAD